MGMYEEVVIEFMPEEFKTYEESFTVITESEAIAVKMIASPSVSVEKIEVAAHPLPTRIDFFNRNRWCGGR